MSNSSSITFSTRRSKLAMPYSFIRLFVIMVILTSIYAHKSDRWQLREWCVVDEQFSDEEIQMAMNWACVNGAECGRIQKKHSCYHPNTLRAHASYVFNSYYQRMKHKGGICYFHAAAIVTDVDPSHGSCKFEYRS